ncbi:M16 family metallopeptidase [Algihabitans albus]|uniref:M16 family metallopeptidase n=1 Tax=Algihabitans albus TaxID=2164067 RepID=UPI000E5D6D58|nr:pitrilysin family protein [Algihabitans albus]
MFDAYHPASPAVLRSGGLRAGLALLAAITLLGILRGPAAAQVFEPETFTLDNGLQVVVVENRRAPIVTHMLWYKVGSADEPRGQSGIAHFLEHLMFKGTDSLAPGEFSDIVARNGGRENAFTSLDYTAYFQTVAKDRLELMMRNEADRMHNLVLSDEVVVPERDVVLEERSSRTDNDPSSQLWEMVRANLYLHHPYGTPVIGWQQEIEALDTEDALAFYDRWYAPNNAVLVISGDVTVEEVRPLAERYYGVVPHKPVPERIRVQEPQQWAGRRVELSSPRVGQPSVSVAYLAPSFRTSRLAEMPERPYALQVLSEVLGGSTGRLYRSLVIEQGLAAGAGNSYDGSSLDGTHYTFWASPRPGVEVEAVETALRAEIEAALDEGVTADEVREATTRLTAQAIYARDSVGAAPRIIGAALATGSTIEDLEDWPNRIAAVTAEQVTQALRDLIDPARSVTGILRSEPTT